MIVKQAAFLLFIVFIFSVNVSAQADSLMILYLHAGNSSMIQKDELRKYDAASWFSGIDSISYFAGQSGIFYSRVYTNSKAFGRDTLFAVSRNEVIKLAERMQNYAGMLDGTYIPGDDTVRVRCPEGKDIVEPPRNNVPPGKRRLPFASGSKPRWYTPLPRYYFTIEYTAQFINLAGVNSSLAAMEETYRAKGYDIPNRKFDDGMFNVMAFMFRAEVIKQWSLFTGAGFGGTTPMKFSVLDIGITRSFKPWDADNLSVELSGAYRSCWIDYHAEVIYDSRISPIDADGRYTKLASVRIMGSEKKAGYLLSAAVVAGFLNSAVSLYAAVNYLPAYEFTDVTGNKSSLKVGDFFFGGSYRTELF